MGTERRNSVSSPRRGQVRAELVEGGSHTGGVVPDPGGPVTRAGPSMLNRTEGGRSKQPCLERGLDVSVGNAWRRLAPRPQKAKATSGSLRPGGPSGLVASTGGKAW